jgi:hypothetical protein
VAATTARLDPDTLEAARAKFEEAADAFAAAAAGADRLASQKPVVPGGRHDGVWDDKFGPTFAETATGVRDALTAVWQALAEVPDKITATIQRGAETEAANAARARSLGRGGSSTTSGSA